MSSIYPFAAIAGQEDLQRALLVCAVNPAVGGLLIRGDKGAGKTTAVRGLADLLPPIKRNEGCKFNCLPAGPLEACEVCHSCDAKELIAAAPFVNLPLGATEDRVLGSLDFERALKDKRRAFLPGLLASAHRGILYIDEVNLLADHLVDSLLDAAAAGMNTVEREGLSLSHPARFTLIGTMNAEEGELRPQLLDRFGMSINVSTPNDYRLRAEIVGRRLQFENEPERFRQLWVEPSTKLKNNIAQARLILPSVVLGEPLAHLVSKICLDLGAASLRADIIMHKVAITLAALDGRLHVSKEDVSAAAALVLPHRRQSNRGRNNSQNESESLKEEINRSASKTQPLGQDHLPQSQQDDALPNSTEDTSSDNHTSNSPQISADEQVYKIAQSPHAAKIVIEARSFATADGGRVKGGDGGRARAVGSVRKERPQRLDIGATINHSVVRNLGSLDVQKVDLHETKVSRKSAALIVFCVDSSGSMAALRRMETVKGAVFSLLQAAYEKRDLVSVITFRGENAELTLAPTGSIEQARKHMGALPTGGQTPLADALRLTREKIVENQSLLTQTGALPFLVLLTDGKANVPIASGNDPWQDALGEARKISKARLPALVVDTEEGYTRLARAAKIAEELGAEIVRLEEFSAESLTLLVRQHVNAGGRRR